MRERLAATRSTLATFARADPPLPGAVTMLDVLERLDARLAGL